jgi:hypothetical protein
MKFKKECFKSHQSLLIFTKSLHTSKRYSS